MPARPRSRVSEISDEATSSVESVTGALKGVFSGEVSGTEPDESAVLPDAEGS